MFGAEGIERYGSDLPVGDGESDDDNGERHQDDCRDDFAENVAR
jgi:hypothetical protein